MNIRDVSLITLISGMVIIFIGMHNIDISYNMNLLKDWKYDMNLIGELHTSREIYLGGLRMLFIGIFLLITSFLIAYL